MEECEEIWCFSSWCAHHSEQLRQFYCTTPISCVHFFNSLTWVQLCSSWASFHCIIHQVKQQSYSQSMKKKNGQIRRWIIKTHPNTQWGLKQTVCFSFCFQTWKILLIYCTWFNLLHSSEFVGGKRRLYRN